MHVSAIATYTEWFLLSINLYKVANTEGIFRLLLELKLKNTHLPLERTGHAWHMKLLLCYYIIIVLFHWGIAEEHKLDAYVVVTIV